MNNTTISDRLNKSLDSMDCVELQENGTLYIDGFFGLEDLRKMCNVLETLEKLHADSE